MVQLNTPSIFGAWQKGEDAAFQQKQRQSQLLTFAEEQQARRVAAERETKLREAIASGINPSTPEGLGQLLQAGLSTEDYFKALDTQSQIRLADIKGQTAQQTADAATTRAKVAERNADTNAWQARQQIDLKRKEEMRLTRKFEQNTDKTEFEAASNFAQIIAGVPEEQRSVVYSKLQSQYGNLFPRLFKGEYTPEVDVIVQALANNVASTGKPIAVPDPSSPTGFTYQVQNEVIGQPAPAPRGENIESSVQKFGKQADVFVGLDTNLGRLEGILGSETENLPGAGFFGGKLPESTLGPQGKALREATFAVANEIVKLYAGSAVTGQEAIRLGRQLGIDLNIENGTFTMRGAPSETALRLGVKGIREVLDNRVRNLGASYPREVMDIYEKRGGELPRVLRTSKGGETPTTETNAAAQPAPANGGQANDPLGLRQ